MAKRVSIFVDPVPEVQHSASEDCLAESKSVGSCYRRRSSSLDNETRQRVNRKSLAEKVHSERMRIGRQLENVIHDKAPVSKSVSSSVHGKQLQKCQKQEKLEQEIRRLKTSLAKSNESCAMYKEKYDIAAKTASELQTQLDEVTQLQHAVCEAHDVQVETSEVIKKAHSAVLDLYQRTKLERQNVHVKNSNKGVMKTGRQLSTVDEDLDEQQKLTAELEVKQLRITELEEKITAVEQQRKLEVSELQQSLESREQEFDKQCRNWWHTRRHR